MGCHSPLSALLALEAGFEAVWASGFELSALYGLLDAGLVTADGAPGDDAAHGRTHRAALVIADLDTGFGNAVNAAHAA